MTTKIKSTSIDSANTFSFSNVVITGAITANSVAGVPSQVLSYDGSKVYWSGDAGIGRPYIGTVYIANSTWNITGSQDQYSVGQGQPVISNYNSTNSAGYVKIVGTGFKSGCNVYFDSTQIDSANVTFYNSSELRIRLPFFSNFAAIGNTAITILNTDSSFCNLRDAVLVHNESNYGFLLGGNGAGGTASSVERLDFSTTTAETGTSYPITLKNSCGVTNKYYSYSFSGYTGTSTFISTIYRLNYATDVVSSQTTMVDSLVSASTASNGRYAYIYGGIVTGGYLTSRIEKFSFSAITSQLISLLPAEIKLQTSVYGANYGWVAGGMNLNTNYVSSIYRHDFTTDTFGTITQSNLSLSKQDMPGSANKTYGWFFSGYNGTLRTNVDRITFSSSTVTSSTARSAGTRTEGGGGASENSTYCWTYGTNLGTSSTNNYRMDFASETQDMSFQGGITPYYGRVALSGHK